MKLQFVIPITLYQRVQHRMEWHQIIPIESHPDVNPLIDVSFQYDVYKFILQLFYGLPTPLQVHYPILKSGYLRKYDAGY